MSTYELPSRNPLARPFRVFAAIAIFFLVALLVLSYWNPDWLADPLRKQLGYGAIAITCAAMLIGVLVSGKNGIWKWKRTFRVELTTDKIITKRVDHADVEIPLNEIQSIQEVGDWLVIRGGTPLRGMAIPREICDSQDLRGALERHHGITTSKVSRVALPLIATVMCGAAGITALYFSLASQNHEVQAVSGAILSVWFVWGLFVLIRIFRRRRNGVWVLSTYVASWLALAWFRLKGYLH